MRRVPCNALAAIFVPLNCCNNNTTRTRMSAYATLSLAQHGATAVVTINRPEVLNALSQQVLADLRAALTHLEADPAVRGIVLTGAGAKAFVAGADIAELTTLQRNEALAFSTQGQQLFAAIENCPKPVVAAVNGFALGGGCELAMACHLRMAAENAKFGQPEIKLGIIAGYGGTQRLAQLVGKAKALELLLTGDPIDAAEAHRLGLVNHVVPADELLTRTLALLDRIYLHSPLAAAYTIDAVNAGLDNARQGYETEALNFAKAIGSEDGQEGTAAFLQKRKPNFTGR